MPPRPSVRQRALAATLAPGRLLAAAALLLLPACSPAPTTSPDSAAPTASGPPPPPSQTDAPVPAGARTTAAASPTGDAAEALLGLPVRPRGQRSDYDRDLFGPAWADTDRNGCDTRNDVLRRDLREVQVREGTRGCVVVAGVLDDPYSGRTLTFSKEDASAVQVDHVVSLSDAWQTGARTWEAERRLAFANDPLNLLAVDGRLNQAKSDSDAASWLPPARPARCPMVARQVAVKARWDLWVKPAEREAVLRVLRTCPGQPLPAGSANDATPAGSAPTVSPGLDPDHGSCRNAISAGHGPYVRGVDPEYGWYVDGDADGTVCE